MLFKLYIASQKRLKLSRYAKLTTMTKFGRLVSRNLDRIYQSYATTICPHGRACHHSTVTSAISDVSDHRPL